MMQPKQSFYRILVFCITAALLPAAFSGCGGPRPSFKLEPPAYSGGAAVIFRMDDGERWAFERTTAAIIEVFKRNNALLDIGVIPYAHGKVSYDVPFLKQYKDDGVISISMHGLEHVHREFDTRHSGKSYDELKSNLIRAREEFKEFFGEYPVAFTVPYDYFTEDAYRAIGDAGFKIFSVQKANELYPSTEPVDFSGNPDKKGLYRLCTVSDVTQWDAGSNRWGEIFPADRRCPLFGSIEWGLENLEVAVVGIHPQAFCNKDDVPDPLKLEKLEKIVKRVRNLGTIITFDMWYRWREK